MNQYSVLFDNAGAQLPPMDGSIILKDGRYCLFDNDRNCLVTLPCTFGVGEVGTMLQCEPVDELRREYGWKYRIEEKGLWGWIHPQFQQVIPPIFNTFHFTTEDSSCLMMATVPGSGAHYVRGLWVLCGHWSKAVLAPLKMPANSVRTLEDGSPDAHFIILDYPMWTMNCRIRFWNREENGQQLSCVSVYADQCNEGALVTGNTFYWEVGTDGPTDFTDIRITGTSSNTHFVFYPDGRRSAFSCPGHPDEQFLPYIRKLLMRNQRMFDLCLFWMDAIGLGIFTVTGIRVAYAHVPQATLFLLIFVGVVTGAGGGLMRDVMAGDTPYIFVRHVYASASVAGAVVCGLAWHYLGELPSMLIGAGLVILIRALSRRFNWNLPRAHD